MKKQRNTAATALGPKKALSNHEIVTLAVYLLGGESQYVDTEDVAVKANEIAPGRFCWVKYPSQINIHTIKTHLWDSKSERKGSLLLGSEKEGWSLTASGVQLAKERLGGLKGVRTVKKRVSIGEKQWMRSERLRMLSSEAFQAFESGGADAVTQQQAEAFFRLNDYIIGKARKRKIVRIVNAFGDDPELGNALPLLATKVQNR
jgi:hypothetical protein